MENSDSKDARSPSWRRTVWSRWSSEEPRKRAGRRGRDDASDLAGAGSIQAMNHDEKGDRLPVDRVLGDVRASEYDALLLPGGVANPDRLRTNERAVQFVREFMLSDKPVAAICHGPWMLVEADAVAGRTLTSWPSLKTDIRNAGGEWVDEVVRVDDRLITSRKPEDLPRFCATIVKEFASRIDERRADAISEQSFPASDPPSGPMSRLAREAQRAPVTRRAPSSGRKHD